MSRLTGKVAIITGAGDGIGRVMAHLFAGEGASVVLVGRRKDALDQTAASLAGPHSVVQCDVTSEVDVREMVAYAVRLFGHVDVLLNNAAQPGKDLFIWEQTLENWNGNIAVNVTAPMLCTREVLKQSMLERRSGSIVNFSSYASWKGKIRKSHYCVSKSGLRLLTKTAALEAGPYNVRVNCVVPGATKTDLLVRYMKRIAGEQNVTPEVIARRYSESAALQKINEPLEVAQVALFLASDESSGITGQSISVDAGTEMIG